MKRTEDASRRNRNFLSKLIRLAPIVAAIVIVFWAAYIILLEQVPAPRNLEIKWAEAHLYAIGQAFNQYRDEHGGRRPTSLSEIYELIDLPPVDRWGKAKKEVLSYYQYFPFDNPKGIVAVRYLTYGSRRFKLFAAPSAPSSDVVVWVDDEGVVYKARCRLGRISPAPREDMINLEL